MLTKITTIWEFIKSEGRTILSALCLMAGLVCLVLIKAYNVKASVQGTATPGVAPHVAPEEVSEAGAPSLASFIDSLMTECGGGKHSPAKRRILSLQIERAASKYLEGTNRHAFAALICLETRMGSVVNAISHAGARGVSQLMPATAKAEAVRCGLGEVSVEDLMDNEINLNIAACHYAKLVEDLGPMLAVSAYNGGSASESVKALQRLTPPKNLETAGYASAHAYILARFLMDAGKSPKPKAATAPIVVKKEEGV